MREWVGPDVELAFDLHGKMTPALASRDLRRAARHAADVRRGADSAGERRGAASALRARRRSPGHGRAPAQPLGVPPAHREPRRRLPAARPRPRRRHLRGAAHRRHGRGRLHAHRAALRHRAGGPRRLPADRRGHAQLPHPGARGQEPRRRACCAPLGGQDGFIELPRGRAWASRSTRRRRPPACRATSRSSAASSATSPTAASWTGSSGRGLEADHSGGGRGAHGEARCRLVDSRRVGAGPPPRPADPRARGYGHRDRLERPPARAARPRRGVAALQDAPTRPRALAAGRGAAGARARHLGPPR